MKKKLRYLLFLTLSVCIFYAIAYRLVDRLFRHSAEILVSVKAFKSTNISLLYADSEVFSSRKSDIQPLIASQFFKTLSFKVPTTDECRFLRLSLGETDNTISIEKITVILKKMGRRDTLMVWGGKDIRDMVLSTHNAQFTANNPAYLHVYATGEDPFLSINNAVAGVFEHYYQRYPYRYFKTIVTSFLLAAFLSIGIFYFLSASLETGRLLQFLKNGGMLTASFLAVIFLVFINDKLGIFNDRESGENRTAAMRPDLTVANFFDYPELLSNALRDNFSFRNYLFHATSLAKVKLFNASPLPNEVIVGKNGWFFYNETGSIEDARKMAEVDGLELSLIAENLVKKRNWLSGKNIKFYVIVPPNKDRVYPEFLPDAYFQIPGGMARIDAYRKYLLDSFQMEILDPTDSLLAAKKRREVYYKTDTHWNLLGGFKGYQVLMSAIARDFPSLRPLQEEQFWISESYTDNGDITQMISLQEVFRRKEYTLAFKDTSKHLIPPANSDLLIRFRNNKTVDGSELKLLMFRDSYANYLIPFLNVHFKNATYVWSYEFMDKLIEEEKPDVVVFEALQRFAGAAFMLPNPAEVN